MAVARDALGIRFTSDPVTVTVSNAAPPPTVTRVEETDSSITYTPDWFQADPRAWSGGPRVAVTAAGGEAAVGLPGTAGGLSWVLGGPGGDARAFADGGPLGQGDSSSPTAQVSAGG